MKRAGRHMSKIRQLIKKQSLLKTSLILLVAVFGITIFSSFYIQTVSAECTNPATCGGTTNHQYQVDVFVKYDPAKNQTKDTINLTGFGISKKQQKTVTISNHASHATFNFSSLDNVNETQACSSALGKCQSGTFNNEYVTINMTYSGDGSTTGGDNPPASDTAQSGANNTPLCGSDNSNMSWLICPVYNIVAQASDSFDNLINKLLHVNTDVFKSGDRYEKPYYTAWASFRNIALIFVIIAGVVMVIAQATGARSIDAYTIKRVMPRLLFAAIAITLSWIVLIFLINVSNVVGEGVQALIYGPFNSLSSTGGGNGVVGGGVGSLEIATIITGSAVAYVLTGGGLLSFIAVAAIAILVGLLVVVLRQILVVFLLIIAPLAIAAYVLPNTQKMAHEWWEWFLRALIMFPLITAFIAVGKVFSLVSLNESSSNPAFGIVAILAYILPYFLLPFTFKFAGAAMGTLAQGVHGFGKKAQGSGMMAGLKEHGKEKNKLGTRFGRGSALTSGLSDATQAAARAPEWVRGHPRNWRGQLSGMRKDDARQRGDEAAVKDPKMESLAGDTDTLGVGVRFEKHHSDKQLAQDLFENKYTDWDKRAAFAKANGRAMTIADLSPADQNNLAEDKGRITSLYRTHGQAAQRAFLNKLSQDPNGWLEQTVYEREADGRFKTDEKGERIAERDANGNVKKITVAQQAYQAAIDYGNGDFNETVRAAMMIRANQARAGRGDVADTSAGTLIGALKDAMANNRQFSNENAQTIISNGIVSHDAIDQARQKPRSVEAKVDTIRARVSKLTGNGRLTIDQVISNSERLGEKDPHKNDGNELKQLVDTMQNLGAGMAVSYSSAEVGARTQQGMEVIIHNKDIKDYVDNKARNMAGGSPQESARIINDQMEADRQARERPPEE